MIALASKSRRCTIRRRAVLVRAHVPTPVEKGLTDDSVIAHSKTGDDQARAALVCEHAGRMLAVATGYLHSTDDAADAVQDAFVAALTALPRFRGDSALGTWLHRIVVNVCLMRLRSRRSQATQSLDALLPLVDGRDRPADAISPSSMGVAGLELHETRALVRACIDKLPADQRAILLLRDIDGFDTTDTAELLGISRVAVKTRLHRARQALRTLLAPHFADEAPPAKCALAGNRVGRAASNMANCQA